MNREWIHPQRRHILRNDRDDSKEQNVRIDDFGKEKFSSNSRGGGVDKSSRVAPADFSGEATSSSMGASSQRLSAVRS